MEEQEKKIDSLVEEQNNSENEVEEKKATELEEKKDVSQTEEIEKNYYSPIKFNDNEEFYTKVEDRQKKFVDSFNKTKKINLIFIVVFIVVMVALIFFLKDSGAFIPVMAVLAIGYFVVLHLYSKKVKAKLNDDATKIIVDFFVDLDSFVLSNEAFTEVEFNVDYKLDEDLLRSLKIVKDISKTGGRDVIKGKIFNHSFIGGDALLQTKEIAENQNAQEYIVFLGKLLIIDIDKEIDGRAIIYLKGKGANGPTDIDDLNKVENVLSNKYDIYSSFDVQNFLSQSAIEALEEFEINDSLIDMFIAIEAKRLIIGLSYSDGVMRVPLLDPIVRADLEQYYNDIQKVVKFVGAVL